MCLENETGLPPWSRHRLFVIKPFKNNGLTALFAPLASSARMLR